MKRPLILHADMDAFYASVEQLDHPELRGKPVIVGGLGPRGVVTAASYEARPFGVHSAMPATLARRLCPHGVFLPGRMARYAEVSRQVFAVFREFTPVLEPLSLDEAFLDVTASLSIFGTPLELAVRLRERVRAEIGLAVSVGIGPSKMVAKIASARAKPDGLLEILPEAVEAFLSPLPVSVLWGVGPVTERTVVAAGFRTVGELAAADPAALRQTLGRLGLALHDLACGRDPREVEAGRQRRSYGEENTFARDLEDGQELRQTIVAHAEAVARRLRADGATARTVVLRLKLAERIGPGKYRALTRSHTLPRPTDDGKRISDVALDLWQKVAPGKRIRLIGVAASGIVDEPEPTQLPLLESPPVARRAALNRALDAIAARHGEDAVARGGARVERAAPTLAIKAPRDPSERAK